MMYRTTLLLLLAVAFLASAISTEAEEKVQITRVEAPGGPNGFYIRITGETKSSTGYLHSSTPFTLRQAIEAAGGIGEWAGEIFIYSPALSPGAPEKLEKRIYINSYIHHPEQQNLLLTNGWHIQLKPQMIPF